MFRDRNEQLAHLIKLCQESSPSTDIEEESDNSNFKSKSNISRADIEAFSSVLINYMVRNKELDMEFLNKLYDFDSGLFFKIFKTAIQNAYSHKRISDMLRLIGEVTYFAQAIEGYKTIYDQIKDNLPNFHVQSFKLREKLEKMTLMKDFPNLSEKERSCIEDMIKSLEPYAMLLKPVKLKRRGNWAEHYFNLGCVEKEYSDERNNFYSLFRTET